MKKKIIVMSLVTTLIICNSFTVFGATSTKDRTAKSSDGETWTYHDGDSNVDIDGDGKESDGTPSNGQNVTASYDTSVANTDKVFSLDISWGKLSYKYATTGGWDATSHNYGEGTWSPTEEGDDVINVTNHSNIHVDAIFEFKQNADADLNPLTSTFSEATGNTAHFESGRLMCLDSAVGTTLVDAPTGSVQLGLTNNPGRVFDSNTVIGTVTVTLQLENNG